MKSSEQNVALRFRQRVRFSARTEIIFRDDCLEYSRRFPLERSLNFRVRYSQIPENFDYKTQSFKSFGFLSFTFLALIMSLWRLFLNPEALAFVYVLFSTLVALAGIFALTVTHLSKKRFTVLPTGAGDVFIWQDRQHDSIIRELEARRWATLQSFAKIDPLSDPWSEIKKFKYLMDQSVVSEEQFASIREQLLDTLHSSHLPSFGVTDETIQ